MEERKGNRTQFFQPEVMTLQSSGFPAYMVEYDLFNVLGRKTTCHLPTTASHGGIPNRAKLHETFPSKPCPALTPSEGVSGRS